MLNSLYTSILVFPYPLFHVLHSFLIELKKSYFNSLSSLNTSHASLPSALCSPFSPPNCSSFDPQVQIPHAPSSFVHRLIQHLALEHLTPCSRNRPCSTASCLPVYFSPCLPNPWLPCHFPAFSLLSPVPDFWGFLRSHSSYSFFFSIRGTNRAP